MHPNHYVFLQAYVFQISHVLYTVATRYNAVVGIHEMEPRYTRGALYIIFRQGRDHPENSNQSQCAGCAVYAWFIKLIGIDKQHKCVLR